MDKINLWGGCQDCLEEKVNSEVEWPTDFNAVFTL